MREIVHNSSNCGAPILPPHPHDEFMRLSALSTTGELTPAERLLLEDHLAGCDDCREAHEQYRQIVADVLPLIAAETAPEPEDAPGSDTWSLDEAQRRLMDAIDKDTSSSQRKGAKGTKNRLLSIALLAIAGAGALGYCTGKHRWEQSQNSTKPALVAVSSQRTVQQMISAPAGLSGASALAEEIKRLERKLRVGESQREDLRSQLNQAHDQLSRQSDTINLLGSERDKAEQKLAAEQESTQSLQVKLAGMQNQPPENSVRLQDLQARIASLNQVIEAKDKTIAEDADLLAHDRDIRNLMGARNLYIAEIYDVAKNGATQKPFGRIFYTRDKSLIFYGFDLDQQPQVKDANVFQAWGRQGSAGDVSLGLLYLDDASKNRWALKVNDAQTLARLDAVFVTVEPKGGSSKPSGKPLLFTYLRIPPNHP